MSNKHRKHSAPKPTIEEFFRNKVQEILDLFPGAPMRVTIIARQPQDPDAEIVFSNDRPDDVIAVMQRRRDAVIASEEEAKSAPSVDPRQQQGE